ncbi:error-prone DNA polymerase [Amaricoccus macauensis]|uniref:error-prone DNA polymerase n=1 Tax=Amaricoccus macauensis TaxID=57001 RepID=UPI003C7CDFB6
MPEQPPKHRPPGPDPDSFPPNPPAPFVELGLATCFSFLRGASEAGELAATAHALGYDRIGIADLNTLAGVVRMHTAAKATGLRPLIGCRLRLTCGAELLAYPKDRDAYGRLSTALSRAKMRDARGNWQAKGETDLTLGLLATHAEGLRLIVLPDPDLARFTARLPRLRDHLPSLTHIAARHLYRGDDRARINRLAEIARSHDLGLLATNDVLYHAPEKRPLQDVMTCIREKTTVAQAGYRLEANAERHLKGPAEMARLFADHPGALAASLEIARACTFSLDDLAYEYPRETVPEGRTPQSHLADLTWKGAAKRYPEGIPAEVRTTLEKELALIGKMDIARYFLTVDSIVRFAREEAKPPILAQGRGSAANSAVCFCLGITAVDPDQHDVLFERFISEERDEPPDIDVDFEHERREEVIQHIYALYGRDRAGLCATVIHYRPRSAVREVGKVMGLSEDMTSALAGTVWGSFGKSVDEVHVTQAGLDPEDPLLRRVLRLAGELTGLPRHLSQHVGGFILTNRPLIETVPVGNGAMADRSFIEWDKDDIDALGIFKMDVLSLGMLTCIAKCLDLIAAHHGRSYDMATIPQEDEATYDMLCAADSVGVFQVESRAQMAMLPKLRPREFYDLVIEVAIVRPGPIQGDMVHPYLRRRAGLEPEEYPSPGPGQPPDELRQILGRTKGVPIFQEQAMKIAIEAARFSPAEANELRKAMATFRSRGTIGKLQEKMVGRMVARGYDAAFAQRCFDQIKGFGEYGFPESHAASFAKLVYVSAWIKCHYPEVFACGLLNSQPLGFYAPAQIVRDARDHGIEVREADVNHSEWDCTLEPAEPGRFALRLGLRQIDGLQREAADRITAARDIPFQDIPELRARTRLGAAVLRHLAEADALRSMGLDRRTALWETKALRDAPDLPLFTSAETSVEGCESEIRLPAAPLCEQVVADYQTLRLSLKAHPMRFFRESLRSQGYATAAEITRSPHGRRRKMAGLVLIRQRPGSAKGVCFITLEDETGVTNAVVWPDRFARFRAEIMGARLMAVHGRVQTDGQVVHLVAERIEDRSDAIARMSSQENTANGPTPARGEGARHPRDVRVIPKSRDFH